MNERIRQEVAGKDPVRSCPGVPFVPTAILLTKVEKTASTTATSASLRIATRLKQKQHKDQFGFKWASEADMICDNQVAHGEARWRKC